MKRNRAKTPHPPIVRLRVMLAGVAVIALVLTGPFLAVWKEVYINASSMRLEAIADSLAVLSRQSAALRLNCERLSSNERIESFARSTLDLEYPSSSQIVILQVPRGGKGHFIRNVQEFFADLRRSREQDKG